MFSFTDAVILQADHIAGSVALPVDRRKVGDEDVLFFNLSKGDRKVQRMLLTTPEIIASRPLAQTSVIEDIVALRDKLFLTLVFGDEVENVPKRPKYTTNKTLRRKVMELDDVGTIIAPNYGDIEGIPMKVLVAKPGSRLSVELTMEVIEYLVAVVAHQIAAGEVHRQHPRMSIPEEERETIAQSGVCRSYSRGALRATFKTPEKIRLTRYFKTGGLGARENAEAFAKTGVIEQ